MLRRAQEQRDTDRLSQSAWQRARGMEALATAVARRLGLVGAGVREVAQAAERYAGGRDAPRFGREPTEVVDTIVEACATFDALSAGPPLHAAVDDLQRCVAGLDPHVVDALCAELAEPPLELPAG